MTLPNPRTSLARRSQTSQEDVAAHRVVVEGVDQGAVVGLEAVAVVGEEASRWRRETKVVCENVRAH
jgi:hypothetical protein